HVAFLSWRCVSFCRWTPAPYRGDYAAPRAPASPIPIAPRQRKSPASRTRPGVSPSDVLRRSAAGARADHEAVVGVFGDLPPQIFVGAVGLHGVDRLLEVGILGRDLRPQFVGRLQTG